MSKYFRQTSTQVSYSNKNGDSRRRNSSSNPTNSYDSQNYNKNKHEKLRTYTTYTSNNSSARNDSSYNGSFSNFNSQDLDYDDNNSYSRSKSMDYACNDFSMNRSTSGQMTKSYETNNKDYYDINNNNEYKNSNDSINMTFNSNVFYARNRNRFKTDKPLFSRLFILCAKETSEQELSEVFEKYGKIQDIWIVRDQNTNMEKGYAYIKFSKASEATKALEEMNGCFLKSNPKRSLKIFISDFKNDQNQFDYEIYQRMQRLFVVVDKNYNKYDLRNVFKKYGEIKNAHIVMDHDTKESKGLGYVTFYKASDAAKALEECDKSFRAKFANLKPQEVHKSESFDSCLNEIAFNLNVKTEKADDEINTKNYEPVMLPVRNHVKKEDKLHDISNENDDIIPISSDESLNPNTGYDDELEDDDEDDFKCVRKKDTTHENFSLNIKNEKTESETNLTVEEKIVQPKRPHSNSNQPEMNETILSLLKLGSILKSVDREKINSNISNKASCSILVKSQLNECFLRKILDLIPGLNEVRIFYSNNKTNTNQYLVKYENDLIASHAVQKLNGLEFPNGEKTYAEIFNEKNEFDQNQFKNIEEILKTLVNLNTTLNFSQTSTQASSANHNKNLLDCLNNYLAQQEQIKQTFNSSVNILSTLISQIQTINPIQEDHNMPSKNLNSAHNIKNDMNTVFIKCRNEIPKELFELVIGQFNNLNYIHLNDDRLSGYANFNSELDALLAVNTLNEREIANNYFRARLGKEFEDTQYQSRVNLDADNSDNSHYFNSSKHIYSIFGNHYSSDNAHEESKSKRFCASK